jgi:oligopeptidase A
VDDQPVWSVTCFYIARGFRHQGLSTALLEAARGRLEGIAGEPGERTFDNTMRALDELTEPLDYAMGVVRHLESVATYPELRAAFNAVQPEVSAFYSTIPLHASLWEGIKTFAGTDEAARLAGERQRFLKKTIETFRRHGADLDAAGKKRLEAGQEAGKQILPGALVF